jgi:hypothetical protein
MLCSNCGEREATVLMLHLSLEEKSEDASKQRTSSGWVCSPCAERLVTPEAMARLNRLSQIEAEENDFAERSSALDLRPLLLNVGTEAQRSAPDVRALLAALEKLLEYLSIPTNATRANLRKSAMYIAGLRDVSTDLPEELVTLLLDVVGSMPHVLTQPELVEKRGGSPRQLLQRVRALRA